MPLSVVRPLVRPQHLPNLVHLRLRCGTSGGRSAPRPSGLRFRLRSVLTCPDGTRATRKPRRSLRFAGPSQSRYADRQSQPSLLQPPPRITRYEPSEGPAGLCRLLP